MERDDNVNFKVAAEDGFVVPHRFRNKYPGDPLPDNSHIRLIEIWTSASGHQVCQHLHTVLLGEVPEYHALSYFWGTTYRKDRFLGFSITDNLYSALVNLAEPEPRFWWIDALCINQEDVQEKNQQVKLMKDIYSRAKKVFVWLGQPCWVTFELLLNIWEKVGLERLISGKADYDHGVLHRFGLPDTPDPSWYSLLRFFARPYFSRIWVVQELVIAGYANTIGVCGRVQFPWLFLAGPMNWLLWQQILSAVETHPSGDFEPRSTIVMRLSALLSWPKRLGWEDLLMYSLHLDSTDPRDKIIALSGLVSEQDSSLAGLTFDYGQPVADFFHEVTGNIMIHTCALALLTLVPDKSQRKIPGLPSWVPDFTVPKSINLFSNGYAVSSNKVSNLFWHRSSNTIIFDGLLIDELEVVAEYVPSGGTPMCQWIQWFSILAKMIGSNEWELLFSLANPDTMNPLLDQFWRCLLNDRGFGQYPAPETFRDHFAAALHWDLFRRPGDWKLYYSYAFLQNLVRQDLLLKAKNEPAVVLAIHKCQDESDRLQAMPSWWILPDTWFRVNEQQRFVIGPPGYADTFRFYMSEATLNTRFFITKAGRVGRGPVSVRRGDRIAVAKGSSQVFVLRKALRYYRLMGECYVGGLMYGEGHRDNSTYERITLI